MSATEVNTGTRVGQTATQALGQAIQNVFQGSPLVYKPKEGGVVRIGNQEVPVREYFDHLMPGEQERIVEHALARGVGVFAAKKLAQRSTWAEKIGYFVSGGVVAFAVVGVAMFLRRK